MDVIEPRQHGAALDRHGITGRLDHEYDIAILDRQNVAALLVGLHHLAPIGHEHAGYSRIAGLALAVAGAVLEYHAGRDRAIAIRREGRRHASGRRRKRNDRAAASYNVTPSDRVVHVTPPSERPTRATDSGRHGSVTREQDCGLPAPSDSGSTFLRRLDDSKLSGDGGGGLQAPRAHR